MTRPASIYIHPECEHCLFLGGFRKHERDAYTGKEDQYYDLYLCTYSNSLIARYGDNGAEYFHSPGDNPSQNNGIYEASRLAWQYRQVLKRKEIDEKAAEAEFAKDRAFDSKHLKSLDQLLVRARLDHQ